MNHSEILNSLLLESQNICEILSEHIGEIDCSKIPGPTIERVAEASRFLADLVELQNTFNGSGLTTNQIHLK